MFREHKNPSPPSLYESFEQLLNEPKRKELNNPNSWHNLFRENVTFAIDEKPFAVLYDKGNGCPNAPVRILLAMMILKEGYGWSDNDLFLNCRFNLLVMNALGLSNLTEDVPAASTYYELRRKIYEYQITEGKDLIGQMFEELTNKQAEEYLVKPDWIRMDSKLVSSNIANCSRLQLIINCLQEFYKNLSENLKHKISEEDKEVLEELKCRKAGNIVYNLSNEEKQGYLTKLGWLLERLLRIYDDEDSDKYKLIKRVFQEQYKNDAEKIELKSGREIPSDSLQSAYDPEAGYRNKNGVTKGYSVNLTETCNSEGLNLVTAIEVETANTPDTEFLIKGVEKTERIIGEVKQISTDGAYNSEANQRYTYEKHKELYLSGIQGRKGRYEYERIDKDTVKVTDRETGKTQTVKAYSKGKYKIRDSKGKTTYFRDEHVASSERRRKAEELAPVIRERRCNIEASIFQLGINLNNKNKTKYRGKYKTNVWALCRVIWMNLVRIKKHAFEFNPNIPSGAVING